MKENTMSPPRRPRFPDAVAVLLALAILCVPAGSAAHRGRPVRLGSVPGTGLELLAQVIVVGLVEGQGLTVKNVSFDTTAGLLRAFDRGEIEMMLEYPPAHWMKEHCSAADVAGEAAVEKVKKHFQARFPEAWTGLFAFAAGHSPCAVPAVTVRRDILENLYLASLGPAVEKILGAVGGEDLEKLRREGGGTGRDRAAAVRRFLKGKGLL